MVNINKLQKEYEKRMAKKDSRPKMPSIFLGVPRDTATRAYDEFRSEYIPKAKMKKPRPPQFNHKQVQWNDGEEIINDK